MKKKLIFDFDGVICDSTVECLYVAYNAYYIFKNQKKDFTNLIDIKDIDQNFTVLFKKYRSIIKGANQFYNLVKYIKNNKINDKNYEELLNISFLERNKFTKIFYELRSYLKRNDLKSWIKLHLFNLNVVSFLKDIVNNNEKIFIATLKDEQSVKDILEFHGLNLNFIDIVDKDFINNKLEGVEYFSKKYDISKKDFLFIEDNLAHILFLNKNGIKVFFASWFSRNENTFLSCKKENITCLGEIKEINKYLI